MRTLALAMALLAASPALSQQAGVLQPGVTVEVETDASSFSSFSFWHDAKKAQTVEIAGPTTKQLTVEPDQRVGFSAKYNGRKVKLQNKGDTPINYKVD